MNDCLVTAINTDNGVYMDGLRGLHYPCYGLRCKTYNPEESDDVFADVSIWACNHSDASILADRLTQVFPGRDIKIFNLTSISTRPAGEIKHKQVTKDGIFP